MANITDKGMQAKPTDKDQWLTSPFKRGAGVFVGRITPTGERLFYFRYTSPNGKRPFFPIGPYHTKGCKGLSLAEAYGKACELSELYRQGVKDLHKHFEAEKMRAEFEEKQRIQDEQNLANALALENSRKISLKQLFERWAAVELKPHLRADGRRIGRKDGGSYTKQQFERRLFPSYGDMDIREVRKADLIAVLDKAKSEGKRRTCNMLLADMKQMFRFACTRELIDINPLETVSKKEAGGADVERTRNLSEAELSQLKDKLANAKLPRRTQIAALLILGTGCRVSELTHAKWANVDLKNRKWYLPDTKNQRSHTIHLSDFSLKCFRELMTLQSVDLSLSTCPWVFPNINGDGPVCSKSFSKQMSDRQKVELKRLTGRTKLVDSLQLPGGKWTPHDLRRTAATLMARLGVSTDVIDECLNHKLQSRISRVYIHDRREAQQVIAFDMLGKKLSELMDSQSESSNVVALKLKRA